jgi:BASS family bile acid:Na+ symporter
MTNPFTQLFLPAAVVAVMFALGTTLRVDDLRRVLSRPRAFALGSLLHVLLLPAFAFALGLLLDVPGKTAAGLVLIAACPANSAANLFTYFARGDTMLSVSLTAATSLLSVATLPLLMNLALANFTAGQERVALPVARTALGVFLIATLPVIVGMALRRRRPDFARAVEAKMTGLGLAVIGCVILIAIWSERANVPPALAESGGLALALNGLAVASAWGLSAAFGIAWPQRVAIGLECGLQNFAMAAFVALTLLGDVLLLLPAIAYGLTMWLSAGVVVAIARRRARAEAAPQQA